MGNQEKQSVRWANEDIEIYYNFLQSKNPTGYTLCPVYAHEGDSDEWSTFDAIQLKRSKENKYSYIPQYIEIKGRRDYSVNDFKTAIVDLPKVQELQQYGLKHNMQVFIVNLWHKDNKITIHEIDLFKDYEKESEIFKKINKQTAGKVKKGKKKMAHLSLYGVKQYDYNFNR